MVTRIVNNSVINDKKHGDFQPHGVKIQVTLLFGKEVQIYFEKKESERIWYKKIRFYEEEEIDDDDEDRFQKLELQKEYTMRFKKFSSNQFVNEDFMSILFNCSPIYIREMVTSKVIPGYFDVKYDTNKIWNVEMLRKSFWINKSIDLRLIVKSQGVIRY